MSSVGSGLPGETPGRVAHTCANDRLVARFHRGGNPLTRFTRQQGFSLIEALIALSILIFALTGLAYLMASTIDTNGEARRQSAAL